MKFSDVFDNPVIAAARNEKDFEAALLSEASAIFLLFGNIMNITRFSKKAREKGKYLFLHLDFIDGLSKDNYAIEYIIDTVKCAGVLSTSSNVINYARSKKLIAIQRFFLLDSLSLSTLKKNILVSRPDLIEIMPALMPKIIKEISSKYDIPVIAGGLIHEKEDIMIALRNGAFAVSTGKKELWNL